MTTQAAVEGAVGDVAADCPASPLRVIGGTDLAPHPSLYRWWVTPKGQRARQFGSGMARADELVRTVQEILDTGEYLKIPAGAIEFHVEPVYAGPRFTVVDPRRRRRTRREAAIALARSNV